MVFPDCAQNNNQSMGLFLQSIKALGYLTGKHMDFVSIKFFAFNSIRTSLPCLSEANISADHSPMVFCRSMNFRPWFENLINIA